MGSRTASLLTELNESRQSTFTIADAQTITGLSQAAAGRLVQKAQKRGLFTRLKPGLYTVVPFELGRATTYIDHPYVIAREMADGAPYFLSHATAFEVHRMVTQPGFVTYVTCARRVRPQTVGGYDFRFVLTGIAEQFGVMKHWIDKARFVMASDLERTVIDGLCRPEYVGGITEVAKGLWMRRGALDARCVVDYALRLDVGAVIRRLGFLLERYELAEVAALDRLRAALTATYQRLDPLLPPEGPRVARWRLQINVPLEELDAVRFS